MPDDPRDPRDRRTRLEKLLAVAQQDESPTERDAARAVLATKGMWPPPPTPPAPPAAPPPDDGWQRWERVWRHKDLIEFEDVGQMTAALLTVATREAEAAGYEVNHNARSIWTKDGMDGLFVKVVLTVRARRYSYTTTTSTANTTTAWWTPADGDSGIRG